MNRKYILIISLLFLVASIFALSIIQKDVTYKGQIQYQYSLDENGGLKKQCFLIVDNKMNINNLRYFDLNMLSGKRRFVLSNLEFKNSGILIKIEDIDFIGKNSTITLYERQESILSYLLNTIFNWYN